MFGKCWTASRISLVNVGDSEELNESSPFLTFTTFTKEMCETVKHLPHIYHKNLRLSTSGAFAAEALRGQRLEN